MRRDEVTRCPWCGGELEIVTDGAISTVIAPGYFIVGRDHLRESWRPATFAACSACEFCQEIVHSRFTRRDT